MLLTDGAGFTIILSYSSGNIVERVIPVNKWDDRFMEMAHVIAGWTSCYMPGRSIGCVIVKDKRIMTTGYNGAPAGLRTCR